MPGVEASPADTALPRSIPSALRRGPLVVIRVLLVLVASLIVFGSAVVVYALVGDATSGARNLVGIWDAPASDDPTPRLFQISEGESATEIGQNLEREGLIRSALVFRWLVQLREVETSLSSGEYELRADMTTGELVEVLAAGGARPQRMVTIPEGWRAAEIARHLEALGYVSADEFLDVVATPPRIAPYHRLLGDVSSLEGYLFPDTYALGPDVTAEQIVETMVRQFDRTVDASLRSQAEAVGLSLHEAVTLASIIEREAGVSEERRLISSVFHNRLRDDMLLQADPTVQYAVGSLLPTELVASEFWPVLEPDQLEVASAYNTYLHAGLPPGPICNPGLASIQAAVDPVPRDYVYFVARGDGTHVFARTLDEHLENVIAAREDDDEEEIEAAAGP